MALFVTGYVASGLVGEQPWLCSALLAALFVVGWLRCDGSSVGLLLAALTAIGGTAVEMALVGAGAFAYLHPSIGGVAVWLPLLYCCASVGVGALGDWLVDG